jgi:hypothetical protein
MFYKNPAFLIWCSTIFVAETPYVRYTSCIAKVHYEGLNNMTLILTYATRYTGTVHSTRGGSSIFSIVRNPTFVELVSYWSIVRAADGVELASWSYADELIIAFDEMHEATRCNIRMCEIIGGTFYGIQVATDERAALQNYFDHMQTMESFSQAVVDRLMNAADTPENNGAFYGALARNSMAFSQQLPGFYLLRSKGMLTNNKGKTIGNWEAVI